MTLSTQTFHKLADALVSEVEDYIQTNEQYADFMYNMIAEAIQSKLGELDNHILGELTFLLLDRIYLTNGINKPKKTLLKLAQTT